MNDRNSEPLLFSLHNKFEKTTMKNFEDALGDAKESGKVRDSLAKAAKGTDGVKVGGACVHIAPIQYVCVCVCLEGMMLGFRHLSFFFLFFFFAADASPALVCAKCLGRAEHRHSGNNPKGSWRFQVEGFRPHLWRICCGGDVQD